MSAVAAAAYRSGEKITNEWDGMIHDYTRKRGIVHSEILLPSNAPPNFQDRGTLWNSVEQIEKACNSQLARELEVALPIELSREEQVRIVRAYCSSQFVSRGMCADFNIHDTGSGNPHAHILLTMRPMDERGVARQFFCETRTEFLRKNSQVLRSKSETRSLASTAPKMEGAVHVKGRVLAWGGTAFAAPPLAFCPWGSSYPSVASPASSAASWAATGSVYSDQP